MTGPVSRNYALHGDQGIGLRNAPPTDPVHVVASRPWLGRGCILRGKGDTNDNIPGFRNGYNELLFPSFQELMTQPRSAPNSDPGSCILVTSLLG
jgi:hypothetical protein